MTIHWQWRSYAELSPLQIHAIFAARQAVFVVEQACPYLDIDGKDLGALHLAGETGVLNLLAENGWQLEQLDG